MKLGINCGSGQRLFTTTREIKWVNVDKISRSEMPADLICDGTHLPNESASVDYFVLHHVLEHFGCGEGKALIAEAYRVLKPGGSLLVFVPNMRSLAMKWLEGSMDTQLYLTSVYGAYMGHEEDRHKWGYDEWSLAGLLAETPWNAVKRFDWRVIPGADISRDWWICGMECRK